MRAIAITNQKGGSGKTTSAVNIAAALGRTHRVLVVDFDPQANASAWLGIKDGGSGLLEALTDGRPLAELAMPTETPGVEIIPASAWLRRAEKSLASEPGAETIFRRALLKLPKKWDVVLVDCSPWLGLLTISALTACSELLVPVEASTMATEGLAALTQTVDKVREGLNPALKTIGILPFRVDERRRVDCEVVESLRRHFGRQVLKSVIHESARLREAHSHAKAIEQYAPNSRAAKEFRSVVAEISRRN